MQQYNGEEMTVYLFGTGYVWERKRKGPRRRGREEPQMPTERRRDLLETPELVDRYLVKSVKKTRENQRGFMENTTGNTEKGTRKGIYTDPI